MKIRVENLDGEMLECVGKWEICDRCRGDGVHDHPAFSNGLSQEDFDEDPDFREDFMRGHYDVPCAECHGSGKIAVPDLESGPSAKIVKSFLDRMAREEAEMRSIEAAERRMGA